MGACRSRASCRWCESFDTVGPLCRSVEDAALMLAALEGGRAADLAGASLEGARLMILQTVAMDDLRPEPEEGFERAVLRLEAAGATVERRALGFVAEAHALSPVVFAAEAYASWEYEIEAAPEKMFGEILNRFRGGKDVRARDFIRAWQALRRYRAMWADAVAGYDAVILPTAPNLPPKIDLLASDPDYYVTENLMTLRNTRVGNLMGLAALTLPTGVPSTGIMFLTPPGSEARLLRLGAAAEAALA
jgi:aspartyl-tRNA(Asn)/glutamyl-tRNA(Gln) amidotransferase subunit A